MRKPYQIAVLCSDLHLSLNQPVCRVDDDWLEVQASYLGQLKDIAKGLPVICAGDIFDRWNVQPELIHFALRYLPDGMICVPGQHDLPDHRLDQVHRSGYGVLMEAKKIHDISGSYAESIEFVADGFAWGQEIKPPKLFRLPNRIQLAVIHQYCWTQGKSYPGAPSDNHCSAFKKQLKEYDAAVFGDNHMGFLTQIGDCNVINTGGFIRRKSDEIDCRPQVGILMSDGVIKPHLLDTHIDHFHEKVTEREELPINMKEFIDGLENLGEHGLNFKEAVENHLRTADLDERTKQIILGSLDHERIN